MIVLDTHVVSEFMNPPPAVAVMTWLNAQHTANLYLTSISIAEVSFGLRIMPEGKRRRQLGERFERFPAVAFDGRVLPFGDDAARIYGDIRGHRRELGQPMSNFDGQIAAIARSHGFALATRNLKDFQHCGLDLIDPFAPLR